MLFGTFVPASALPPERGLAAGMDMDGRVGVTSENNTEVDEEKI